MYSSTKNERTDNLVIKTLLFASLCSITVVFYFYYNIIKWVHPEDFGSFVVLEGQGILQDTISSNLEQESSCVPVPQSVKNISTS